MLRIGKLTDYATVLMTWLATRQDEVLAASELAELSRLELPTVSKLLKQLTAAGLIESRRGIHGGYRLAFPASEISVLQIVVAMEGPMRMTECSAQTGACEHEKHCSIQHSWRRISRMVESVLKSAKLVDLIDPAQRAAMRSRTQSVLSRLAVA